MRLSSYSSEALRAKAQKARAFAERCDAEAERQEALKLSDALLRRAKELGVEPAKVLEKLNANQGS